MKHFFDPKKGELIVVLARVFGAKNIGEARMALDTGAMNSLLSWDFLIALGYDPGKEKDRIPITTGS